MEHSLPSNAGPLHDHDDHDDDDCDGVEDSQGPVPSTYAVSSPVQHCPSASPPIVVARTKHIEISPLEPGTPQKKRGSCLPGYQRDTDFLVETKTDTAARHVFLATPLPNKDRARLPGPVQRTTEIQPSVTDISKELSTSRSASFFDLTLRESESPSPTARSSRQALLSSLDRLNASVHDDQIANRTAEVNLTLEDNSCIVLKKAEEDNSCLVLEKPEQDLVDVYGGKGRRSCKFRADQVIDVDDVPYYPESSSSDNANVGTLYVINLARMTASQKDTLHTHIAYSHDEKGSSNVSSVKYANAGLMKVRRFACNGVKLCSGLHGDVVHSHIGGSATKEVLRHNASLSRHFAGLSDIEVPAEFAYGPSQPRLDHEQMAYAVAQQIEQQMMQGKFCHYVNSVMNQPFKTNVSCGSRGPTGQHRMKRDLSGAKCFRPRLVQPPIGRPRGRQIQWTRHVERVPLNPRLSWIPRDPGPEWTPLTPL